MIQIECPFCGKRDQSEFSYGREGQITFPALNADENSWYDAVFLRKNTYGRQALVISSMIPMMMSIFK